MQTLIKIALSVIIILAAISIGRRLPSAAGLIAVMPLAGAVVLVWMYLEHKGDPTIMQKFTLGALWGIIPSIFFYIVALICFKKHLSLPTVLCLSFGAWLVAAFVHQSILK
jgi:uncharacterized membrane protein (GlpM family)